MHFHGGGYALCSSTTHRMMISEIARASGARGLGVDYRLAPEHPYPAALDDCESAYHGILRRGVSPNKLLISGDSAGGALALATLIRLKEQGLPLPRALVLLSPWVDLECHGETVISNAEYDYLHIDFMKFFADIYLDGEEASQATTSPINADLSGFPQMLIHAGSSELMYSDIQRFAERARQAGVEVDLTIWDGMVHAFQGFTLFIPEARDAVSSIGDYFKRLEREDAQRSLPPATSAMNVQ